MVVVKERGEGGAPAAYQWAPFKFPGIIGGKEREKGEEEEEDDARCLASGAMTG